jgi:hypothetical protein
LQVNDEDLNQTNSSNDSQTLSAISASDLTYL